jgi:hypothetical protein
LTSSISGGNGATEGVAAIGDGGHLLHHVQRIFEEGLLGLI